MKVKVKFFAILREKAGAGEVMEDIESETTVGDLWTLLQRTYPNLVVPGLRVLYAVNRTYVTAGHVLHDNDEVVFVPPVSGG